VEIDEEAFLQASTNAENSPWADRITFLNRSFQDFYRSDNPKFDLIVSNPPFYQDHLKSKDRRRNMALHNDSLPFSILMEGTSGLLTERGSFWVILPLNQMKILKKEALKLGLSSQHTLLVKDNPQKKPHREIRSFGFDNVSQTPNELIIKDIRNSYSVAYATLLKDFPLIF
jgi:tRNA1Val (adenine37-N6)-methyltransferase